MRAAWLVVLVGCAAPPAEPDATPSIEAVVEARCATSCHGLDWVERERADAAGWSAIIDRMIAYGATVSLAEQDAIAAYLADVYGP